MLNVASWLHDTISVKQRTGLGADGTPTYDTASDVAARVLRKTEAMIDEGERIEASHHVTVLTEISEDDQLQLPGESVYRRPVRVEAGRDKFGTVTHYEVWL